MNAYFFCQIFNFSLVVCCRMCYNIKKFKGEVKFMRLSITHTKNNTYFYMIKSYRENGKNKTKIIERLGELKEVEQKVEKEEEPVVVTAAEDKEIEPKVEERDVVKEQIDGLKAEIETLKNEIADLKNTLSNIVSKPAVEPIVEEFEKVKNIEIKGNKAAKLFAHLKK